MARKLLENIRNQWMGALALFLVLTGGSAYALSGSNNATPLRTRAAQGGCAPTVAGTGAMVKVGSFCIDKYEASVWSSPRGGTQYGVSSDDYPCNDNGQNCSNIYARSVAGVKPARYITWFQAQQALANSRKRLPSNAEWQEAVRGTPDAGPDNGTTDCNTGPAGTPIGTGSLVGTGSRSSCVSDWGAYDMVGNLNEWVADWVPASNSCPGWGAVGNFSSDDTMCLSGASTTARAPGALVRGNDFGGHMSAGPFTVYGLNPPSSSNQYVGFRGAR
jgi:formylglycine-generating enzyme required for sulfatase activity